MVVKWSESGFFSDRQFNNFFCGNCALIQKMLGRLATKFYEHLAHESLPAQRIIISTLGCRQPCVLNWLQQMSVNERKPSLSPQAIDSSTVFVWLSAIFEPAALFDNKSLKSQMLPEMQQSTTLLGPHPKFSFLRSVVPAKLAPLLQRDAEQSKCKHLRFDIWRSETLRCLSWLLIWSELRFDVLCDFCTFIVWLRVLR